MSPPTAPPATAPTPGPWRALRHYRKTVAGMSIAELAGLTQLSKSYLEHLEAGRRKPSKKTVEKLATALGTTVGKLRADLTENPAAEEQLAELTQQVEVLAERIEQVRGTLTAQQAGAA